MQRRHDQRQQAGLSLINLLKILTVLHAAGAQLLDCLSTVESQVQNFGGRLVLGGAIWKIPQVLIEAEFHAVWEPSDDGFLIDISAHPFPLSKITFLPDPQRVYLGREVDKIRKPLSKDP